MTLLAGTRDGLHRVENGTTTRLADGEIAALASDAGVVWAVIDDRRLWRGQARGGFDSITASPIALRCLLATDGEVYLGTAQARLLRLDHDHLDEVDGFAETPERAGWYTPWGGPPDTRSLAAAPDGTLYANVHVGGVPRSDDDGYSWTPTIDIDADVHQVIVDPGSGLVLCAAARGLAVSADRGRTWQWRTAGLHAHYARAVAVAGDTVVLSVSQGPGGQAAALYRAPLDGDEPFVRCDDGLPEWFSGNVDTHCLVADGATVTAADGGTLYRSTDAGATWDVLARGLAPVTCLAPL